MSLGQQLFFGALILIAGLSFFLPIVTNPQPVDCTNYPDGTGGYYPQCKDEYINLYTKIKKY